MLVSNSPTSKITLAQKKGETKKTTKSSSDKMPRGNTPFGNDNYEFMIQNLPSTSFQRGPIYSAVPHSHTLTTKQGHFS